MEIWKLIPGFSSYEVSNLGRVRSFKRKRITILSPSKSKFGYYGVNLCSNGKASYKRIAYLVMLSFIGNCPTGLEICHGDGNPGNNHLSNLRYDTHRANMLDAVISGRKYQMIQ